jgi:hypothetical protein
VARVRLPVSLLLVFAGCVHAPAAAREGVVAVMERHVQPGGPNHRHMLRLARLVPAFARAERVDARVVEAAALLHDATKEHGDGTPLERFCTHHLQAAALARDALPALGFTPVEVDRVAAAIEQHMGPLGANAAGVPRFMSGFCRREFPMPATAEAKVLFDLDMLDLMTVDGVVKVVTLRQRNPEFGKETLRESALTGKDPAWKSVEDAHEVLLTATGRACGDAVRAHTRAFLDAVDFDALPSVDAFAARAATFLEAHPLPPCVRP